MEVSGKMEEEKVVVKDDEGETLQIVVKDQSGEEVFFKVKPKTQMGKIFDAYAKRRGVERSVLRFMLDGHRVLDTDTPQILQLEDRDQIDCLLEQIGGWW
jgi:small ubiquitin-related modifier